MKTSLILIAFGLLLGSCNKHAADNSHKQDPMWELKVSDLVPCTEIEEEGYLVNPLPDNWTPLEKEMYHQTIDFWAKTTDLLWSSQMIKVYTEKGADAYKEKFIALVLGSDNGTDGLSFTWQNRFDSNYVHQINFMNPCDSLSPSPDPDQDAEGYTSWLKNTYRCVDIIFNTGVPCCLYVEKPYLQDSITAIVPLRLYDQVNEEGFAHLNFRSRFFFDKRNGQWVITMQRTS